MNHLFKLVPLALRSEAVEKQAKRGEIRASECKSEHFRRRYHEITVATNVQNQRPHIMLVSNMAMVWAEIVLHKRLDWRTTAGLRTWRMHSVLMDVRTAWIGDSDCPPLHISNRRSPPIQNIGIQTLAIAPNVEDQQRLPSQDDYEAPTYNNIPGNRGGHYGQEYEPTNFHESGPNLANWGHCSRIRYDLDTMDKIMATTSNLDETMGRGTTFIVARS